MRILVAGTGAVGGYFGGRLALRGHEMIFLARGAHGARIRERGLTLSTPEGERVARGRVIETLTEARGLAADLTLVAVKTGSLAELVPEVGATLGPAGFAVPLENGLDSEAVLAAAVGRARVLGATTHLSCRLAGPGHVELLGGGAMTLAALEAAQVPERDRLASVLGEAFPCRTADDLALMLWQKLLWNAPFNAICALTRLGPGQVLEDAELEALVRQAMAEVTAVARAEGVALTDTAIEPMLAFTRGLPRDAPPSMLQDVLAGRVTEASSLQGAVVTRADRHDLAVPIHRTLLALLRGVDLRGASRVS